jgi:hypothetical protein
MLRTLPTALPVSGSHGLQCCLLLLPLCCCRSGLFPTTSPHHHDPLTPPPPVHLGPHISLDTRQLAKLVSAVQGVRSHDVTLVHLIQQGGDVLGVGGRGGAEHGGGGAGGQGRAGARRSNVHIIPFVKTLTLANHNTSHHSCTSGPPLFDAQG